MSWKGLIRAFDPRVREGHARRVAALDASNRLLRQELRDMHGVVEDLSTHLVLVQRQLEQLVALRREDAEAPARLDDLARVMDVGRISAHIGGAVADAEFIEQPVPHLVVRRFLPDDVYDAMVDAIPAPVFFDGGTARAREIRVPPLLAPLHSVAAWSVVADAVADSLTPALLARVSGPLERYATQWCASLSPRDQAGLRLVADSGRILLRAPGRDAVLKRRRPWQWLMVTVDLARVADTHDYGSALRPVRSDTDPALVFPFRANSALVVVGPVGAHDYVPIPMSAPDGTVRYSYEVRIGLGPEARRALMAGMTEAELLTWNGSE